MISQNIRSLREHGGFTQEGLANQLGVARQTVAKWEAGEAVPDLENVQALADLFNVSIDNLVKHDEVAEGYPVPPRGMHIFGVVRVGERGQIVIPKRAREVFDIHPGTELLVLGDESQGIGMQKVEDTVAMMEQFGRAISEKQ